MVDVAKLDNFMQSRDAGFRSLMMFDQTTTDEIREQKNSKGFDRFEVYSDILFIDIDTGDRDVSQIKAWICDNKYPAEIYLSGGKGYHFHIPIEMMRGQDVPYSQKIFLQGTGLPVDLSIYRASGLIALPGRRHPKTGVRKTLVETLEGSEGLSIPIVKKPEIDLSEFEEDNNLFARSLIRVLGAYDFEPGPGNRHMTIWSIATNMRDAGLHYDTALDILEGLNKTWQEPKESKELEMAVQKAYGT